MSRLLGWRPASTRVVHATVLSLLEGCRTVGAGGDEKQKEGPLTAVCVLGCLFACIVLCATTTTTPCGTINSSHSHTPVEVTKGTTGVTIYMHASTS